MWRDTAIIPKLFILDARCFIPLFIFLLHMKMWTFWLALIGVGIFAFLERKGISAMVLVRMMRNKIAGNYKIVVDPIIWRKRLRKF